MKLRVEAADAFFYPDVMVSCDPRDHAASQFIAHPAFIVEVLSEVTAAFDRGDKFAAYRTLTSLQEYVLVDIPSRRVETFRRTPENDWLFHEYLPDGGDPLFPTLQLSIPFDETRYSKTSFRRNQRMSRVRVDHHGAFCVSGRPSCKM